MSHEYVTCKMCRKPVMEHLANHTEQGSLCDSCYNKSGLREKAERELAESMKTCTVCGKTFLKRNYATRIHRMFVNMWREADKRRTKQRCGLQVR